MGRALETEQPEKLVARLLGRLKRHALWDSALLFFPPALALSVLLILLDRAAFMGPGTLIFAGSALLAVVFVAIALRRRGQTPPARYAARLIDERAEGKERFLTLATLDPSVCTPPLVARLRREAAGLIGRIDLERDFPYRMKRSFFASLAVSLLAIVALQLLFPAAASLKSKAAPEEEMALLARRLYRFADHAELARKLEAAALRLVNRDLSAMEKRSMIRELRREAENRLALEPHETAARELLSDVAKRLRRLELPANFPRLFPSLPLPWIKGSGKEEKPEGAGEAGEGREKGAQQWGMGQEERDSVEAGGKNTGAGSRDRAQRAGNETEKGVEDKSKKGDDRKEKEGVRKPESPSVGKEGRKADVQGAGGQHPGDENSPANPPPARFLEAGEKGQGGLNRKGAPFVTVELPEQEQKTEESTRKMEGSASRYGPGKAGKLLPKVPISNLPLRQRDVPDAAAEKQPLPLEYRGLIR